jgi:hypothetical protein
VSLILKLTVAVVFAIVIAVPLASSAELSGTIVDYAGATQPHAQVMLRGVGKAARQTQLTAADGQFRFTDLASGKYELKVSSSCHKTYKKQLMLEADSRLKLDIALKLGNRRCVGTD